MSYQGEDKWTCFIPDISVEAPTLKELKDKIENKLNDAYVSCLISDNYNVEQIYDIIKINIKKTKNKTNN